MLPKLELLPIKLGIARSASSARRTSGQPAADKGLTPQLEKKVFARDQNTCRYCGFSSEKYQAVSFVNGVSHDVRGANLATACIFCEQCFKLDEVSKMRSGVLVWLPEISQADLHHIARAVYVARISQGPVADAARQTLDVLMKRRDEVRTRLGTDDPFILAMVLKDYITNRSYEMRDKKLEGIRLFPLDRRIIKEADLEFNQFPQILAYWRSKNGPFGGKVPKQWLDIYRELYHAQAA